MTGSAEFDQVLAKAVIRASVALAVDQEYLALVLGCPSADNIRTGIDPRSVSGQRALQFVKIYRALSLLTGSDEAWMRAWMKSDNHSLDGVPGELIGDVIGLERVATYLEMLASSGGQAGA